MKIRAAAFACALTLALSACGSDDTQGEEPGGGETTGAAPTSQPATTDPGTTGPGTTGPGGGTTTGPEEGCEMEDELTKYVGLTEDEAKAEAEGDGKMFRVIKRDGRMLPTTPDHWGQKRVNVYVESGKVTCARYDGSEPKHSPGGSSSPSTSG